MMLIKLVNVSLVLALILIVTQAKATLIPIDSEYIYDKELDITWIANGNLADTLGSFINGRASWNDAVNWVDQLEYGGFDDWRLPIFDLSEKNCTRYLDPSPDACTLSEMAHLYHVSLESTSLSGPRFNSSTFFNIGSSKEYWYGNTDENAEGGYVFQFWNGLQLQESISTSNKKYMFIVRDGDIRKVPEPNTSQLLVIAVLLAYKLKKYNKQFKHAF
jgi:hypothetical protein